MYSYPVSLPVNQSIELKKIEYLEGTMVHMRLEKEDGTVIARGSWWPQPLRYGLYPCMDPGLKVALEKSNIGDSTEWRIVSTTKRAIKGLWFYIENDENRSVVFDDNMVDVVPGDIYVILVRGVVIGDVLKVRYMGDREVSSSSLSLVF